MDYSSIGSIAGFVSLIFIIIDKTIILMNHKRLKSKCCGKTTEVSMDINNITPPAEKSFLEPNLGGLLTYNDKGQLEYYDAGLKKKVLCKS